MATKTKTTSKIVDAVADAVTRAEIAVVRTGRKAVAAVNRKVGAGKRKARRKAAKKAVRKAVSRTRRLTGRTVRKAVKKARKAVRRR